MAFTSMLFVILIVIILVIGVPIIGGAAFIVFGINDIRKPNKKGKIRPYIFIIIGILIILPLVSAAIKVFFLS